VLRPQIYNDGVRTAVLLPILIAAAYAQDTGAIHGRVLIGDKPWAGAVVTAYSATSKEFFTRTATTGADGRYRFEGLPVAEYVLAVGPVRKKPKRRWPQDVGEAIGDYFRALVERTREEAVVAVRLSAEDHPHRVRVLKGTVARHDIRLPREVPVVGMVTWKGKPVVGAAVQFVALNRKGRASWSVGGPKQPPRTDREGVFKAGLPAGKYALIIEIGKREVLVRTREVAGAETRLPIVLGTHTIRVKIEDSRGRPIRKAEFGAFQLGDKDAWGWGVRTRDMTEEFSKDGAYELSYIVAGRWKVYANVHSAHVTETVDVGPATPNPQVVLCLPPTGPLIVRAVDKQGRPVKGVQIRVVHPSGMPGYSFPTNEKGEMRRELRAETWQVGRAARFGLGFEGEPLSIEVKPHAETVVEFTVEREKR
jgi:hypothetical protein